MSGVDPGWCWSAAEAARALELLARRSGASSRSVDPSAPSLPDRDAGARLVRLAAGLGVELEPASPTLRQLEGALLEADAALVRLPGPGERYLAVAGHRGRRVRLLVPSAPGARAVWVHLEALSRGIAAPLVRQAEAQLEAVVRRLPLQGEVLESARRALVQEQLGPHPVAELWSVRPLPGAPFLGQLVRAGVPGKVALLLALHVVEYALLLGSWKALGPGALEGEASTGALRQWGLCLLALVPCQVVGLWLSGEVAYTFGEVLRRRLMFGVLQLRPEELRLEGVGALMGRVFESEAVESLTLEGALLAATAVVELVFAVLTLGGPAGRPALAVVLVGVVAGVAVAGWAVARLRDAWSRSRRSLTHLLLEGVAGHRTRHVQERREDWHRREDAELADYQVVSRRLDRVLPVLLSALPRVWLTLAVAWVCVPFARGEGAVLPLATAVGGALLGFVGLGKLAQGVAGLSSALASWRQVKPVFEAAARPPRAPVPQEAPAHVDGAPLLEARDLAFAHPGRQAPVLDGLALTLREGQRVVLEGRSGGGKSTLTAVLAGLLPPTRGTLTLRGAERRGVADAQWRARVAAAPQFHENHILSQSLAFNLLMGRAWPPAEADLEEAAALCHQLGLGPLLRRMPAGLNQLLGDTGWQLSHGEKSRIFAARALLQRAELVVLDESFGALDPHTLRVTLECVLAHAPTLLVVNHP
ncbi:MAG: ABC transporter ATP-binding protein/permease [Myxococcaceae bacterium]|nr:ABC transporter ATP-binding protein/permease [Myxococcaceae bacterium]